MRKILTTLVMLTVIALSNTALAGRGLPPGNFRQTCHGCFYNARNILRCTCQTANGFFRRTSIRVGRRCDFIQNLNGNLNCTARSRHPIRRRRRKVVVSAGPIFNQAQANVRCPRVCRNFRRWSGQWWTVRASMNSVCECIR